MLSITANKEQKENETSTLLNHNFIIELQLKNQ